MKTAVFALLALGATTLNAHADADQACSMRAATSNAKKVVASEVYKDASRTKDFTATYDTNACIVTVNSKDGHEWTVYCAQSQDECLCNDSKQVK